MNVISSHSPLSLSDETIPPPVGIQTIVAPLTESQIKRQLWARKLTLKQWALENGYRYSTVSAVMCGKIKVTRNYGIGFEIALKLGLVVEGPNNQLQRAQAQQ